ncbi:hypothetical protein PoB_003448600 [Plakobranchus ocellatus]|uniref:Uncharacterized protein n=1 Tax=Plakobranchus ocellatus TaxID=259542 RepID=A0AAV4AN39_9GAST|nr:hypothetical protein PoB_003448600 [Plakobranchus ocellatus]
MVENLLSPQSRRELNTQASTKSIRDKRLYWNSLSNPINKPFMATKMALSNTTLTNRSSVYARARHHYQEKLSAAHREFEDMAKFCIVRRAFASLSLFSSRRGLPTTAVMFHHPDSPLWPGVPATAVMLHHPGKSAVIRSTSHSGDASPPR